MQGISASRRSCGASPAAGLACFLIARKVGRLGLEASPTGVDGLRGSKPP